MIVGLYQDVTEPDALRQLLRAQDETERRLAVRISRNSRFHSKLYLIHTHRTVAVLIGSSNLSIEGLSSDGELIASLSLPATTAAARQIDSEFERMWAYSSPLNPDLLRRYENRYDRLRSQSSQGEYSRLQRC
jgi:HKD family nuclease